MASIEILVVVVLTIINGLLAMSEMAVASSRPARLKTMADQNVAGARAALALSADPGRFLSTVQIGITLIGIIAGAFSGASLGARAGEWLVALGVPRWWAEITGFGTVVALITYLSLIIGELVPKQIALRNPERIACLAAPAMTLLARLAAPVVWLLDRSGRLVLTLLGQSQVRDDVMTTAEIHTMIAEAESAGVLEPEERSMIAGVMRLGDRPVRGIMIPRADVKMVDIKATPAELGQLIADSGHSRFVVYRGNPDTVVGVVQAKDVAAALLRKRSGAIRQVLRQAPIIPDTVDALDVVAMLKQSGVHIGLVHDEYGHFEGIVTVADVLEAIVGAFREEGGAPEPEAVERDDGSLLLAGWAPIDGVLERLNLPLPPKRDYQTLAGFVLDHMGRLPRVGESFNHQGWRFEVVDLDGKRIDKVLVARAATVTHRAR
jgi:putative hemolysin